MVSETARAILEVPKPTPEASLMALKTMLRQRSVLGALEEFHQHLGDIFQLTLPGFNAVMLAGAEAARFVLVNERENLRWRVEGDPVVRLLRRGLLVEDGASHADLRQTIVPALHRNALTRYVETMVARTDEVLATWQTNEKIDVVAEMRQVALLILMDTLYGVEFAPEMERLLSTIERILQYISPGLWVIWRGVPRPGYKKSLQAMNAYLYSIIAKRRASGLEPADLLGLLIGSGMDDGLIRDQLLTMFIAGHDTSTVALSWTLFLLSTHPDVLRRVQQEIDDIVGETIPTLEQATNLKYLDAVINETLRLYPPIHLGQRIAVRDLSFDAYYIPKGTRVMYSIYLTHRDGRYWQNPTQFDPSRFLGQKRPQPYTFLPFGGGARNCIGTAFAQIESKIVLARILQKFNLGCSENKTYPKLGATLAPSSIKMRIVQR